MFFTVDDIIITNDRDFLVHRVALVDNLAYYEVSQVDKKTDEVISDKKILFVRKEEEKLYISEVKDEKLLLKVENNLKS